MKTSVLRELIHMLSKHVLNKDVLRRLKNALSKTRIVVIVLARDSGGSEDKQGDDTVDNN
jgi:hypothetical protein